MFRNHETEFLHLAGVYPTCCFWVILCASYYNILGSNGLDPCRPRSKRWKQPLISLTLTARPSTSGSEGRMDSDECGVWRCWEVWNSFVDFLHALCPFVHRLFFFVMPCVWNASASAAVMSHYGWGRGRINLDVGWLHWWDGNKWNATVRSANGDDGIRVRSVSSKNRL